MSGCQNWIFKDKLGCSCYYCQGKRAGVEEERNRRTCTVARSNYMRADGHCICSMWHFPCGFCKERREKANVARDRARLAQAEADLFTAQKAAEWYANLFRYKLPTYVFIDSLTQQGQYYQPGNLINTTDEGRDMDGVTSATNIPNGLENKSNMLLNLRKQGQEIQALKNTLLASTPMASQLAVMKEIEKLERQREKVQMGIQELVL